MCCQSVVLNVKRHVWFFTGVRKGYVWLQKRREERGTRGEEKTEGDGGRGLKPSSLTPSLNRVLPTPYAKPEQVQDLFFFHFHSFHQNLKNARQRFSHRFVTLQPFQSTRVPVQAGVVLQTCMSPAPLPSANWWRKRKMSQRRMKMRYSENFRGMMWVLLLNTDGQIQKICLKTMFGWS